MRYCTQWFHKTYELEKEGNESFFELVTPWDHYLQLAPPFFFLPQPSFFEYSITVSLLSYFLFQQTWKSRDNIYNEGLRLRVSM